MGAGTAQRYSNGLDDRGSISGMGKDIFLFSAASRPCLGPTQPPIQWVPETVFLEVKRAGHEADHSPPSRADVKNDTSAPPYVFLEWCLIK
jgi:hypothetical protein